jgi:predicted O-methyltransferase YrrM
MAKALPDGGKVTTLELEELHAKVSRQNVENAGLASKVEVIVGPAAETIEKLGPDGSYDLAFIDADKENNVKYFTEAKRLIRSGGVIVSLNKDISPSWDSVC